MVLYVDIVMKAKCYASIESGQKYGNGYRFSYLQETGDPVGKTNVHEQLLAYWCSQLCADI